MATAALEPAPTAAGDHRAIPLDELHESPKNPRKHYEPHALQQLADNLTAVGQITAVVVRPRPDGLGGYELAAGHRRLRAARLAGLPALDAVVRELDDAQFVEILNIENLQRDDLNALEEAEGFASLMTDAGYDVPKIAGRVGRSIKYIYDRLKLRALIPPAKKLLLDGTLTPGHGILLARLGKDDQERALETDDGYRGGGALEHENVDDSYFPGEPELDLKDPVKARSVRELQQWIDRNVRFVPEKVDQGDLAFDLPKTAELLDSAKDSKLKVVKLTREYRVPDQARDQKERTYGTNGWKRADGEAGEDGKPSKTCDYARVGLVVAGPGRGEAFLVCVNKDKCTVHWAKEQKERAQRAKEIGHGASTTARKQEQEDSWEKEQATRQARAEAARPGRAALVAAVLAAVTPTLQEEVLRVAIHRMIEPYRFTDALALEVFGVPKNGNLGGPTFEKALAKLRAQALYKALVAALISDELEVDKWSPQDKPTTLLTLAKVYGVDAAKVVAAATEPVKAKPVQTSAKSKVSGGKKAAAKKKAKAAKKKAKA